MERCVRLISVLILLSCAFSMVGFGESMAQDTKPYLVKISRTESGVISMLQKQEIPVYFKLNEWYIAGASAANLEQLESAGIECEVIDEEAWSDPYYIVQKKDGTEIGSIPDWGEVMWKIEQDALVKLSQDQTLELAREGFRMTRLFPQSLPLPEGRQKAVNHIHVTSLDSDIVGALMNHVNQENMRSYVKRLQDFQTRLFASDSCDAAARWILDKFIEFGYTDVVLDTCIERPYDVIIQNVIATKPGILYPDSVIVVGGHYDSIVYDEGSNWWVWAPGANDNASGVVAVMEAARILANVDLNCTVKFCCWDAEEIGLFGAWDYAGKAFNRGENIGLCFNYDMIAFLNHNEPVRDITINWNPLGEAYADVMVEMAEQYTSLVPVKRQAVPSGSDHAPFMQYGYGIVYAEESDFPLDTTWHAGTDVIENMNIPYMTEVVKIGLGTLVMAAGPPLSYAEPSIGFQQYDMDDDTVDGCAGNGNGFFDTGETIGLTLFLENFGEAPANSVTGTLTSLDPHVTILDDVQPFGTIPSGGIAASEDQFRFTISEACPVGHYLDFAVDATASGGYRWTSYFTVRVEQPTIVYITYGLEETIGDGNGTVDPGETGTLHVLLGNAGLRGTSGITAVLETDDPDVSVTGNEVTFPDMELFAIAQNTDQPFSLVLDESTSPHTVDFTLHVLEGEGYYRTDINFRWLIGQGTALLVADDDDANYSGYYIEALQEVGVPFGLSEIQGVELPFSNNPLDYAEVIWFTSANESNTLTPDDQEILKTFLDGGGRLLLSGSMIGYDIGNTPFYKNYLHASYVSFITMLHSLNGVSSNPVVGDMNVILASEGYNGQGFTGETDPISPAVSLFNYDRETEEGPGVIESSGSGALAVETSVYKVVYCSFGLEGVEPLEDRAQVLEDVLLWFKEPGIDKGDVDGNGVTNIIDALVAVNIVLGLHEPTESELARADMNYDGEINVLDVIQVVNAVLGSGGGVVKRAGLLSR